MTTETVTAAVARRDPGAGAMITQYQSSFAAVVPSHIKVEQWIRVAQGALKKGKVIDTANGKRFELEVAALNNPGAFLASLLDAARLGLEPGTPEYYLTVRKVKGRAEILGITGYQGMIELMYRAGAVVSVIAEVVHEQDSFQYRPGRDEIPLHDIDWSLTDRGPLKLVYAFARMEGGATSKVVVMNRADIARVKGKSQGSNSDYSPWNTDTAAMWLKSAIRQLAKWVPTSAEYRKVVTATATIEQPDGRALPAAPPLPEGADQGERSIADVLDADIVEGDPDDRSDEQAEMEAELQ